MWRCISIAAACGAVLALGAVPASAGTSRVHTFSIPGVYGVRAWGTYADLGSKVRVMVCVKDTARNVYGGAAAGITYDTTVRHDNKITVASVGYVHTQCDQMLTRYTGHLVVDAVSGDKNGQIRQHGRVRRIY